ncbi:MAG: hypothetical protein HYS06_11055 [Methylocystis sp.]|nr:hypothetical protein [Methylocystis sp.]
MGQAPVDAAAPFRDASASARPAVIGLKFRNRSQARVLSRRSDLVVASANKTRLAYVSPGQLLRLSLVVLIGLSGFGVLRTGTTKADGQSARGDSAATLPGR